jgi:hypothetical protein
LAVTPATFGEYKQNVADFPSQPGITKSLQVAGADSTFEGMRAVSLQAPNTAELVSDDTSGVAYKTETLSGNGYQVILIQKSGTYKAGFNVSFREITGSATIVSKLFVNGVSSPTSPGLIQTIANNASNVTTWSGLISLTAGQEIDVRFASQTTPETIQIDAYNLHLNLLETPGTASTVSPAFEYNFTTSTFPVGSGQLYAPTGVDGPVYINQVDRYGNDFLSTLSNFSANTLLTIRQVDDENKGTVMRLTETNTTSLDRLLWSNSQWVQDFASGPPDNNARVSASFEADTLALSSSGGGATVIAGFAWAHVPDALFTINDTNAFFFMVKSDQTPVTITQFSLWVSQLTSSYDIDVAFYTRDMNNALTTGGASYVLVAGGIVQTLNTGSQTGFRNFTLATPQFLPALTGQNCYFMGIKAKNIGAGSFIVYARDQGAATSCASAGLVSPISAGNPLPVNPGAPTGAVTSNIFIQLS